MFNTGNSYWGPTSQNPRIFYSYLATHKRPRVFLGCSIGQLPWGGGKLDQRGSKLRPLSLAIKLQAIKPPVLPDPKRARYGGRVRVGGSEWVQDSPNTLLNQAKRPPKGQN